RVHILEGANLPVETESGRFGRGVAFRGRAARRADDDAVHVLDAGELTGIDHHPLAVVERGGEEGGAFLPVTPGGPGRVADQDVDLARLQRSEAVRGGEVDQVRLLGVPQDCRGDDLAELDVEPGAAAVGVDHGEAGQIVARSATDLVVGHDGVVDAAGRGTVTSAVAAGRGRRAVTVRRTRGGHECEYSQQGCQLSR